eukprot:scaffold1637_cov253-Pinguiococcus_pyrenoidosus.AAC.6
MDFTRRLLLRASAGGALAAAGLAAAQQFSLPSVAKAEGPSERAMLEQILAGVETIKADLGIKSGRLNGVASGATAAEQEAAEAFSGGSAKTNPRVLVLFDVDGTLTPARKTMGPEMRAYLAKLRQKVRHRRWKAAEDEGLTASFCSVLTASLSGL